MEFTKQNKIEFHGFMSEVRHPTRVYSCMSLIVILLVVLTSTTFGKTSAKEDCVRLYPIESSDGYFGYINCRGHVVVKPTLKGARKFSEGVAIVETLYGSGTVDDAGNIRLFKGIDFIHSKFSDGLVFARSNGVFGFVDKNGEMRFKLDAYGEVYGFSQGFAAILIEEKYHFVNTQGELVFNRSFDDVSPFTDGIAAVRIGEKWGAINRNGEFIVQLKPWYVSRPSNSFVNVRCTDNKEWLFFDGQGKLQLRSKYQFVGSFHEGFAEFELDGKRGFIDKSGRIRIDPRFDEVHRFSGGLAAVVLNRRLGFIDKSGAIIIEPRFDALPIETAFEGPLAFVSKDGVKGYIDRDGEWVWISSSN